MRRNRKPSCTLDLARRTESSPRTVRLSSTTSLVFVPSGASLKVSRNCTAREPTIVAPSVTTSGNGNRLSMTRMPGQAGCTASDPCQASREERSSSTDSEGRVPHRRRNRGLVYLSNVSKLAPKTYKAYKRSLELSRQSCKKIYAHQITKQDLQAFDTALIDEGNEGRTRHNQVQHVVTFLRNEEGRRAGPPIKDVSIKVKYVEAPPEAYTRQELEDLFRVFYEDENGGGSSLAPAFARWRSRSRRSLMSTVTPRLSASMRNTALDSSPRTARSAMFRSWTP
jgi:hypothetical protein